MAAFAPRASLRMHMYMLSTGRHEHCHACSVNNTGLFLISTYPGAMAVQVRSLMDLGIGPESLPKKLRRLANGQSASGPRAAAQHEQQQQQQQRGAPLAAEGSLGRAPPPAVFASAPELASSLPSQGGASERGFEVLTVTMPWDCQRQC